MSAFWGCFKKLDIKKGWAVDLAAADFYCAKPAEAFRLWAKGTASQAMGKLQWTQERPEGLPGPFWGGWVFDRQRPWPGFEKEIWCLPKQLLWQSGAQCGACGFGSTEAEAQAHLFQLVKEAERSVCTPPVPPVVAHRLGDIGEERRTWRHLLKAALAEISGGGIQKLVLSRQIHLESEAGWDMAWVLGELERHFGDCWTYALRGEGGCHLIGATPEMLCKVKGRQLETEALAGTAGAGEEASLLHSEKDLREHRWVVEGIEKALGPWSEAVEVAPSMGIRRLPSLIHLHTPIRAFLREGVSPLEVARSMHPTPAVAGTPTKEAMAFLRKKEPFPRGFYAGALGFGNEEELNLFVALRAAKIHSKKAALFVGAGVVEGSSEEREWQETEQKAQALLCALGVL